MSIKARFAAIPRARLAQGAGVFALLAVALPFGLAQIGAGHSWHGSGKPTHIVLLSAANTAQQLLADPGPAEQEPFVPVNLSQDTTLPALASSLSSCPLNMALTARPGAVIGMELDAPCHAGEPVVLRHAGLSISGRLDQAGHLEMDIPALQAAATLEAGLADGQVLTGTVALPDLAGLRRFGLQWKGQAAFAVHGFEGGADFGTVGHVSPQHQGVGESGSLAVLGDAGVDQPFLAQIYTYPKDPIEVEVLIEAEVTRATCGQPVTGQVISLDDGQISTSDLTLAMPDCSALGEFLVLKNLPAEMKLAAN